jgi:hypothetical protein
MSHTALNGNLVIVARDARNLLGWRGLLRLRSHAVQQKETTAFDYSESRLALALEKARCESVQAKRQWTEENNWLLPVSCSVSIKSVYYGLS